MIKNTSIRYLVREIRPWEVPKLKVGTSRECPRATPRPQGGVMQRAVEAYVWENVSEWLREAVASSLELAGKSLTRIANRKLDWVLGASTGVRAWVMSCPALG